MPSRLLIVEAVCAGGLSGPKGEPSPESWRREGRGMLSALVSDLSTFDDLRVTAFWDRRPEPPPCIPGVIWEDRTTIPFIDQLATAASRHDRTLIIAPETDGLLENLVDRVHQTGVSVANSGIDAIRLTTDKLALADHLAAQGVPTIPTCDALSFTPERLPEGWAFPLVVKPRDGAGSQGLRRVDTLSAWDRVTLTPGDIVQPWLTGEALSIAAIIPDDDPAAVTFLPPARQHISQETYGLYLGGELPAEQVPVAAIESLARAALATLPGLRGYIGCDIVWPDGATAPLLCEINPRLTTSFVGYRALYGPALSRALALGEPYRRPLTLKRVSFTADGQVTKLD